jgi:hypothetical protein
MATEAERQVFSPEVDREAAIVVPALKMLLELRQQTVYRSRAWWKLNNAANWLDDCFWTIAQEQGYQRPA